MENEKSRKLKDLLQAENKSQEFENDLKQSIANKSTTGTHRIITQFLEKINLTLDDLEGCTNLK